VRIAGKHLDGSLWGEPVDIARHGPRLRTEECKRFFEWAIEQRVYGIRTNPCQNIKPEKVIGKKKRRQRILSDDELFALWRAAKRLPYPAGPVYRLLTFTALRLNEPIDASGRSSIPPS
jgi:integrase